MPCTLDRAKRFVDAHHRHHTAKIQAVFCVAVADDTNTVRGVAMVGWPVARHYSDGVTIEVNRVATDGCKNACSALLGACRRIAFELGYRRIITYTLHEEGGGVCAALDGFSTANRRVVRRICGTAEKGDQSI